MHTADLGIDNHTAEGLNRKLNIVQRKAYKTRRMGFMVLFIAIIWWCHHDSIAAKPKLLYVNSYHKGYQWSDDIEKGLLKALGMKMQADGNIDPSQSKVYLSIFRMDTKLNVSEAFKQKAGLGAKALIERWQPDIVVTSDDNAAKYLIVPYYMNSDIPFVFCGLNWDAAVYGFPRPNVTGMVEVTPVHDTIGILKQYSKGDRIGYIGADVYSNRKTLSHHKRVLGIQYAEGELVTSFKMWKQTYLKLQNSVDLLIVLNPIGISDWDGRKAESFVYENTKIPSGCTGDHTVRYVLLAKVKVAEEQGWWAGKTALKILSGTPPADIPIAMNKHSKVYVNMRLSQRLGIKLPIDLIEQAILIEELPKRD